MIDGRQEMVRFELNGVPVEIGVVMDEPLSQVLRRLGEATVRESCAVGLCGCCTALVDGKSVSTCLYWAVMADGTHVETLDGLGSDQRVAALQGSIAERGAAQCGYCTPGMVLTALELFDAGPQSTQEIAAHMNGNLCRCACYPEMTCAIKDALMTAGDGSAT
ncbi:(2Fe-2S)-binding protein [Nocardioides bigeumensis]|uniref:(2Fe-2S)-binding protein n=1 Tax=Nocardioides bigeumensis TaxID=433657 RepID=A0ABP5J976_9ACTN